MPQLDFDGANSKISADKIQGQSGTTVTIPAGHNLAGDGSGLTSLSAANLTGTLPAISGASLTSLTAANLTGALPAISGASLTGISGGFTLGTEQATTSGTSINFGSIPSGTTMIIVNVLGQSSSTSGSLYCKIGDSGGIEGSGYLGDPMNILANDANNPTALGGTKWSINTAENAAVNVGTFTLTLENSSSNTWICTSIMHMTVRDDIWLMAGSKSLSGELTQVEISTNTGAFDAGAVNIMYQ